MADFACNIRLPAFAGVGHALAFTAVADVLPAFDEVDFGHEAADATPAAREKEK